MRLSRLQRGQWIVLVAAIAMAACGSGEKTAPPSAAGPATSAPARAAAPAADTRPEVVVLGDSLTAGLGLDPADSYPTLLQQKIDAAGLDFRVSNAGVSGDTSAGGLSRLDWALGGRPSILVVALGGNDALRGLPVAELTRNLSAIIEKAQARNIRVILAGMEAPPNFGQDYFVSFHEVYPALARKYQIPLVPFLLQNVAGVTTLNQRDGIHPTAEGARIVADNVWAVLGPMVKAS
jgi:acyl-CoA thioesterase-1